MDPRLIVDNTRLRAEVTKLTENKDMTDEEFVHEMFRWVDCFWQTVHEQRKAARRVAQQN